MKLIVKLIIILLFFTGLIGRSAGLAFFADLHPVERGQRPQVGEEGVQISFPKSMSAWGKSDRHFSGIIFS